MSSAWVLDTGRWPYNNKYEKWKKIHKNENQLQKPNLWSEYVELLKEETAEFIT